MRQEISMLGTSVSSTYDHVAHRGQAPPIAKSVGPYSAGSHADPSKSPILVEKISEKSFRVLGWLSNIIYDGRSKQKDFCLIFSSTLEAFFSLHCSDLRDTNGHPWHQSKQMQDLWKLGYFGY